MANMGRVEGAAQQANALGRGWLGGGRQGRGWGHGRTVCGTGLVAPFQRFVTDIDGIADMDARFF